MGRMDGKVALVTGGGKGIGRGIARRYAEEGAQILIAEIDEAAGAQTAAEIGHAATFVPTDVGNRDQVRAAVQAAVDAHGRLDVLVNNAIALSPNIKLEEKTDEMLDGVLRTGLWATWWSMHAAFPTMREQGGGQIINFHSIDAQAGAWLHADYNLTKDAIQALTKSVAVEWARFGIRANLIAPAAAGTVFEELKQAIPGFEDMAAAMNPTGRVGDPYEDIAPVAVFLATDESRYVTGETINVDGGQHIPRYNSRPQDL
ncbi:MAG: Short-chain dehydrogenase [Conexibacter sp.]|nr:Short-chain dehydrogenase [Conexibacter sp.]